MNTFLHLVICFTICVLGKNLPPYINRCRESDPDLGKCLEINVIDGFHKFSAGNKDFGIPPLEPFFIKKIEFGTSGRAVSIQQLYENLSLHGMTNLTMSDTKVHFNNNDDCFWSFKTKGPKVVIEADFKITGQILVVPVNGHGKCKIALHDNDGEYKAKCVMVTKKNKRYIRVTDSDYKFVPAKVVFDFENLIDGNEQLSKELLKTINENAVEVYTEVGSGINGAIGKIYGDTINQVFARVSVEELFLP